MLKRAVIGILSIVLGAVLGAQDRPPSKVDSLVASMTLDEKVSMLHGARDPDSLGQAGYVPGVPRLGIPPLRLADGPAGIRTSKPATALPAPVALAATFSPELARQYGRIIGRDARARRQNVVLAPMVNLVRVPQAGRNFETLGEEPLLAGRLVAAEIEGMQGEGVIATIKHYAFNNQENERMSVSAEIDEQTMREIELAGFEAAVRAGVGSVMAAYNRVNGTYAAESVPLLTRILRNDWGFKGFVMSDWGATHSAVPAITSGMEMEMPGGRHFGALAAAVKKGELAESVVDEAVRRILTAMDAAGLLDPARDRAALDDVPASTPEAREIAIAGAVLLKNARGVLPIAGADRESIAVIGPTAAVPLVGGGGSAHVRPMRAGRALDVLRQRVGDGARIVYAAGYDVDGELVPQTALRPAAIINATGDRALPPGTTLTWTGEIVAPRTGDYVLKVQGTGRASLSLGAKGAARPGGGPDIPGFGAAALLPTADGLTNTSAPVHLEAGVPLPITINGSARGGAPLQIRLAWLTPDLERARIDEAVAAAKAAKVAVVFAYEEGTEGRDRASLSLPGYQDALIDAVAAVNPRTIVVLNNGAPVLMPWADRVAAILQMWYPGQEGAEATTAILLGDAAPGGRLPITFPRREADAPTARTERYPGVNGKGEYSEGIFAGHRWYDKENIEPLFAFGHGLSYTTFAYSGLNVRRAGGGYDVSFTLRNTGTREGVEVPQVYIGPPRNAPAPMPVKKLAGFARVSLVPGESRRVTIHVDARVLSYWSPATKAWVRAAGRREFFVGASSRDLELRAEVAVTSRAGAS